MYFNSYLSGGVFLLYNYPDIRFGWIQSYDMDNREDVGRRAGHADLRKFTVVLASCKKLPPSPRLGDLVTHIVS